MHDASFCPSLVQHPWNSFRLLYHHFPPTMQRKVRHVLRLQHFVLGPELHRRKVPMIAAFAWTPPWSISRRFRARAFSNVEQADHIAPLTRQPQLARHYTRSAKLCLTANERGTPLALCNNDLTTGSYRGTGEMQTVDAQPRCLCSAHFVDQIPMGKIRRNGP
jgi:hypothetical protein